MSLYRRGKGRFVALAARLAALPLALRVVLVGVAMLHGVALSWGMPASDSWDVDGIAPRDFLPGLAETFTPGRYFTYPPLHLALLAVLTLPITLVAVVRAGALTLPAIMHEILLPPYMTAMAMVARVVCVLMSIGIVLALAKTAEETAPKEEKTGAAVGAALVVGLDAAFCYYAHVTNLDVPYLFWASLSILALTRAFVRQEPNRLRAAAVFAACAIATKDQAYAMFALAFPVAILAWVALAPRGERKARLRDAFFAGALGLALLLVIDGALFNPSGFRARIAFLSGSASQDFATYSKDFGGRVQVVKDTFTAIDFHYPRLVFLLAAVGLFVAIRQAARGADRVASVLGASFPLLCAISFTVFFNLTARRVEERFTLPQMLVVGMYAGRGLGFLWDAAPEGLPAVFRWGARLLVAFPLGPALYTCLRIDATLLAEPRYTAERWLTEHAARGDVVEVHGLNVYLMRPPKGLQVVRVDTTPADRRNPMPGIVEVKDKLSDVRARNPRFIAVNDCYAWRYLRLPHLDLPRDVQHGSGRILPRTQDRDASDVDATFFFNELFEGRLGYRLATVAEIPKDALFPRYEIHASLGCPVRIFERDAPADTKGGTP